MKKKLLKAIARVLGSVAAVILIVWFAVAQPSCRRAAPSSATVDPDSLRRHVEALAVQFHPRDWQHLKNLDACADYIADHLRDAGALVDFQPFIVGGRPYRNIIGRFAVGQTPRIIVGAHYDAYEELPGADDNASAVAVLIELATLLGSLDAPPPVDLVAYTLEEPPFFGTEQMGSAIHAAKLAEDAGSIRGVIVLEMVGYFSDAWGSQSYPVPLLYLMYPSRGDFIGVVSRWDQGKWVKTVKVAMKGTTDLPVYSIRAPAALPGVDFSDHRNYWPHGIPSLMVTDTAFYRNKAYHSAEDTPDRLGYRRMGQVVVAVFSAIDTMSREQDHESMTDDGGRTSR
jgi:hypothetical protein